MTFVLPNSNEAHQWFPEGDSGAQLGPLLGLRRLKMCQFQPLGSFVTKDRNHHLKSNHFELPVKVTHIVGIEMLLFTIHSRMMSSFFFHLITCQQDH